MFWIIADHKIHPASEGLLPPTCFASTRFRHSAFKIAELQVHGPKPGMNHGATCFNLKSIFNLISTQAKQYLIL